MARAGTVNDKLNTLTYFESIILNSNVANRLINSAFMSLLMKLLKTVKSAYLKIRLCSIIGQLVRHSTVIGNQVAECGLCSLLAEITKDKTEKVRRKAVASLGEFLFYAATQLDDEQADQVWEIPQIAIMQLIKCLASNEDEVVRFYACKTIENITAQSIQAGCAFATLETATLLLSIYHSTSNEPFKISAAVSISHICKLNTTLFPTIFESLTCKQFSQAILDGPPRIQQAFITMLIIALTSPYQKLNDQLQEEEIFHKALASLIDNKSIVIRGKVVLTYLLLFKMNPQWFVIAIELKFYQSIEKLLRDGFKYVQCCLLCLVENVSQMMPQMIQQVEIAFTSYVNGDHSIARLNEPQSKGIKKVFKGSKSDFTALRG